MLQDYDITGRKMPVLFVGHGSPMNAIEDNEFSREWEKWTDIIPMPKAILCISAHWVTNGTFVTAMPMPRTIHDFGGFPKQLYDIQYPAPGDPEFAAQILELIKKTRVKTDYQWGLDHGTWSVLCRMYPKANIPVIQLSIDYAKSMDFHYQLASELKKLRFEDILILGSGNVVHNLGLVQFEETAYDWATEFDLWIEQCIKNRDDNAILNYSQKNAIAKLAVPTTEHFVPLLYILGATERNEKIVFYTPKITMGSLSMRSVKIG
jgi:4,5-DOPA dioxygenase extradiol